METPSGMRKLPGYKRPTCTCGDPVDGDGVNHRSDGPCIIISGEAERRVATNSPIEVERFETTPKRQLTVEGIIAAGASRDPELSAAALQAELEAERERCAAWRLAAERAHAYDITVTISAAAILEKCNDIDGALRYLTGIAATFGPARTVEPGTGVDLAAAAWKAVAVTLAGDAADEGTYLPTDPAILAYNHARNGRYAEALEVVG